MFITAGSLGAAALATPGWLLRPPAPRSGIARLALDLRHDKAVEFAHQFPPGRPKRTVRPPGGQRT